MYLGDLKTEDAGTFEKFLLFLGVVLSLGGLVFIMYKTLTLGIDNDNEKIPIFLVGISMVILGTMFGMWGTIHMHLGKMVNLKSLDNTQ